MKRIFYILVFLISGIASTCLGQGKTFPAPSGQLLLENKEEVYIHYNSTFLLSGETLYYKFYALDAASGKPKDLSKTGYLELIGKDGESIFRHKVALDNGTGYGNFLIPSTVASGSYKLLAYTRWMQNAGKDHFFSGDLVIINPYMEDQTSILQVQDSVERRDNNYVQQDPSEVNRTGKMDLFSLSTTKDIYGKREKVKIEINKIKRDIPNGNFSLSVKKVEEFEIPEAFTSGTYKALHLTAGWDKELEVVLPDLRGQVISGKIVAKDNKVTAGGRSVVFSLPGDPFFTRIAKTGVDGNFLFNLENKNFGSRAYLQVLGDEKEKFEIFLDELPPVEKKGLKFEKFKVTPKMVKQIGQRSIFNQVENSYASAKQDSILPEEPSLPFYGTLPEIYFLDEFTRFPSLQETFIEIIQLARIKKDRDGLSQFELTGTTGSQSLKPLLLVDGFIIQDHEDFIHYDASKVKSIGFKREVYYLGPEVFEGIIAVETVKGDFFTSLNRDFISTIDIGNVQPEKEYFQPLYNDKEKRLARVPDYRLQLLWLPMVEIEELSREITFYTSDVQGDYEITLQGFTEEGEAVSIRKIITVK